MPLTMTPNHFIIGLTKIPIADRTWLHKQAHKDAHSLKSIPMPVTDYINKLTAMPSHFIIGITKPPSLTSIWLTRIRCRLLDI